MRLEVMTEEFWRNEQIRRSPQLLIEHTDSMFWLMRLLEQDLDNSYEVKKPFVFKLRGVRIEIPVLTIILKEGNGMVFYHRRFEPFRIDRKKENSPQLKWVFNAEHAFCKRRYKRRPYKRSQRG